MREKVCDKDIYTALDRVFALSNDTVLDQDTITKIHASGHSRIPVYRKKKTHIIGILLVKDLIIIDPDNKISLDTLDLVMIPQVTSNTPLYDLLNHFQKGKSHMAVVIDPEDFTTVLGIVTLEDIIEELLNVEILDENDTRNGEEHREAIRISIENGESAIVFRPSITCQRPSLSNIQQPNNAPTIHGPTIHGQAFKSPKKKLNEVHKSEEDEAVKKASPSPKKGAKKTENDNGNVTVQIPSEIANEESYSSSSLDPTVTSEKSEIQKE